MWKLRAAETEDPGDLDDAAIGCGRIEGHQRPRSFEKNFCASSARGYRNKNRGKRGPTRATAMTVSSRGPIVTHRIPFTTLTAFARSASDWRSGVPSNGSFREIPSSHFASNSFTYRAANPL